MLLLIRYLVMFQKARRLQWGVTAHSPTPTFKKHVESTQNIIEKYSQTLCRSLEPHIPSSIRRFSLYGFSMLLQYKRALSSEQKHKSKHTLRDKCSNYLSVFSPNAGKYVPEKTANTNTFHAVTRNTIIKMRIQNHIHFCPALTAVSNRIMIFIKKTFF